jgi:predicted ATP-binding protein involved in virulence
MPTKISLKGEIMEKINQKFMEKLQDMINQKVQDVLKKFQDITNKEHEKTQKQINELGEIPRWRLEVGSRKRPSYSEILERCWRHTLQA